MCWRFIFFLVALAPSLASANSQYLYELEGLGDLGGGGSRAAAINNRDWVVGESETESGEVEAFLWKPESGMVSLGTLGGPVSRAYDVNDAGMVVGEAANADDVMTAFVWTEPTGMQALPVSEGTIYSAALAVNGRGQITGTKEDELGVHAVMWSGTNVTVLHRLPGSGIVQPLDLNVRGDVVGQIGMGQEEAASSLAFYFKSGVIASNLAEFRLVSALSGSAAVAVNQDGIAAGYVMLDSSQVRAFKYDPATGLELLENRGAIFGTASDINDDGWIVGSLVASYASDESACVWIRDRNYDLNEVTLSVGDWWLVHASGINGKGMIAGNALRADYNQAFILRPAAEANFDVWPDVSIYVRELEEDSSTTMYRLIEVNVPDDITTKRVIFYQDDTELGTVEEPPYEWGWQGDRGQAYHFHAKVVDVSGRSILSRRIMLERLP